MKRIRALALLLSAGLLSTPAAADNSADKTAPPLSESQQAARELLDEMAGFLVSLDSFSVDMLTGYDVPQPNGQMIQFLESRRILLKRPNQLRINETTGEGLESMVLFDGANVTTWHADSKSYAQVPQPGSVDDTIVYFERDLGMRIPLSAMMTTQLVAELQRNVTDVDYVEYTDVLGEPAHHLAARMPHADFQAWIADSDEPLPLRVVLTFASEGRPQYWAQFESWNLKPRVRKNTFRFDVPDDAMKLPFAAQVDNILEPQADDEAGE